MLKNLDACCGLHERIDIVYLVDCWKASLQHESDSPVYAQARGKSVEEALKNLDAMLANGPMWRNSGFTHGQMKEECDAGLNVQG